MRDGIAVPRRSPTATRATLLEPFVGDRGARDVAAQAFEFLALMRPAAHPGMQAEALRCGAQVHDRALTAIILDVQPSIEGHTK